MANQTYKTIIFEEFDSTKPSLLEIVKDPRKTGDHLTRALEDLQVTNFREFMKKFAPDVYEVCLEIDGKIRFYYTINPDELKGHRAVKKNISDNTYFKMLSRMYSEKGVSGESNLQFDDADILEMLTPKQEVQDARDLRRELAYNLREYYKAEEDGYSTEEYEDAFTDCRKKIIAQYSGAQSNMIPLVLEDLNIKLKRLNQSQKFVSNSEDTKIPLIGTGVSGELAFDDTGRVIIQQLSPPADDKITTQSNEHDIGREISVVIEQDFDKHSKNSNAFVKDLVLSTYAPLAVTNEVASLTTNDIEELRQELTARRDTFEEIFCSAKEAFIKELSKIIERLMGMKIFFDHATSKGNDIGKMQNQEPVIIANCKASKFLDPSVESRFKECMIEEFGTDQTKERVWFAVVPGVTEGINKTKKRTQGNGPFAEININSSQEEEIDSDESSVSVRSLKKFLKIADEAKILTVFNIRTPQGNTFGDLSAEEVQKKINLLPKDCAHGVYAYPNFTLMRDRPGFKPFKPYSERIMTLPGIFIDAAYPAAGLLAAIQQTDFLEEHGFRGNVNKNNPCVRVDFENPEIRKNITTKLNRESGRQWRSSLKKKITDNMFGFVFASDDLYVNNESLKNSYVYCARTLKFDFETQKYKPVYQTLTEDYIACLIHNSEGTTEDFLKGTKNNWKNQNNQGKFKNNVNLVLREHEDIYTDTVDGKTQLVIQFIEGRSIPLDVEVKGENIQKEAKK